MGCCISSRNKIPLPTKPSVMLESDSNHRAPPPPCLEEETIKEVVLSETPLSIVPPQEGNIEAQDTNLIINKHEQEEEEEEEEEISQVSEMYSISESFSMTTTATTTTTTAAAVALTEIKDDEAISKETRRESNYRSPAKVPRRHHHPNGRAKSQAKRAESSSRVLSRPVRGRTLPRNVEPTRVRRDTEVGSSSRRSNSPATGTGGDGAGRRRRRSPGKVTTGRASGGKLQEENEGKKKVNGDVLNAKGQLNESLDNPLVSLECFIFL